MTSTPAQEHMLSIGAVARETSIPVETLRTWERRYGFPIPERTPGGHRKYPASVIEQLQLTASVIAAGHRPANVVGESVAALRALLGLVEEVAEARCAHHTPPAFLDRWIEAARALDNATLTHEFERAWFGLGALRFLEERAAPFMRAVGERWFAGELAVLHEQFASAALAAFLSGHWRALAERAEGPAVLCAALPGEYHTIGLHMISVIAAVVGFRVIFLGCDVPLHELVEAADRHQPHALLISISAAAHPKRVHRQLGELAELAGSRHRLIVGGAGAPASFEHVQCMPELKALHAWAAEALHGAA